jgi:hypothetical protein
MRWLPAVAILVILAAPVSAQPAPPELTPPPPQTDSVPTGEETPPIQTQIDYLRRAAIRLPIAAGLACVLALRPRRKGTPQRQAPVIQTQIILAVVGAVVMLVVGASLARAFGIVGAAGLVRYRAKINDPKDAGVMLSTLAVGLAAGVGLWLLASFGTLFILAMLWVVESFEPRAHQLFHLKVKGADPTVVKPRIEKLLARHHIEFELRIASKDELSYEVEIPMGRKTDRLSNVILALDPENATAVEWEEKKTKN